MAGKSFIDTSVPLARSATFELRVHDLQWKTLLPRESHSWFEFEREAVVPLLWSPTEGKIPCKITSHHDGLFWQPLASSRQSYPTRSLVLPHGFFNPGPGRHHIEFRCRNGVSMRSVLFPPRFGDFGLCQYSSICFPSNLCWILH